MFHITTSKSARPAVDKICVEKFRILLHVIRAEGLGHVFDLVWDADDGMLKGHFL